MWTLSHVFFSFVQFFDSSYRWAPTNGANEVGDFNYIYTDRSSYQGKYLGQFFLKNRHVAIPLILPPPSIRHIGGHGQVGQGGVFFFYPDSVRLKWQHLWTVPFGQNSYRGLCYPSMLIFKYAFILTLLVSYIMIHFDKVCVSSMLIVNWFGSKWRVVIR